jgi:hypothetical protein
MAWGDQLAERAERMKARRSEAKDAAKARMQLAHGADTDRPIEAATGGRRVAQLTPTRSRPLPKADGNKSDPRTAARQLFALTKDGMGDPKHIAAVLKLDRQALGHNDKDPRKPAL